MVFRWIIFLIFSCFSLSLFGQEDTTIYEAPEVEAEFPGGFGELMFFINEHVVYPEHLQNNITCYTKAFIEFVIEKDGSISNLKIRNKCEVDMSYYVDVFNKSPQWNPAKNKGVIVRSRYRLPLTIEFQ